MQHYNFLKNRQAGIKKWVFWTQKELKYMEPFKLLFKTWKVAEQFGICHRLNLHALCSVLEEPRDTNVSLKKVL